MTTLVYNGDTLAIANGGRTRHIQPHALYALIPDQDVHEAAAQAILNPGTVVEVAPGRAIKPRLARYTAVRQ